MALNDGEWRPVWPDLAKFRHLDKKSLGQILECQLNIYKIVEPIWEHFNVIGQILIDANGQILKKYSSHLVTLVAATRPTKRWVTFENKI